MPLPKGNAAPPLITTIFRQAIIEALEEMGITIHELETKLNVPARTVRDILERGRDPRLSTCDKIAKGIGVDIWPRTLVNRAEVRREGGFSCPAK